MATRLSVGLICGHRPSSMVGLWYWKVGRGESKFGDAGFPPIFLKNLKFPQTESRLFHRRTRQKHLEQLHTHTHKKATAQIH